MHVNANLDELAPIGPLTDWLDATIPDLGRGPLRRELQHGGTTNVILTRARSCAAMAANTKRAVIIQRQTKTGAVARK